MSDKPPAVDLHVHSKHSNHPSIWVLRKLGCPESFTDPITIYHLEKALGMTYVTITDHNSIAGALQIAHLPDAFISEEVSTFFPEDNCHIHILAFRIDEKQHEEIGRLRSNVYDLVRYLNQEKIQHSLAHPTFAVNDRLTMRHLEKMLLLFKTFELNGTRDDFQNDIIADVLSNLTPQDIQHLANKHDLEPVGPEPWRKSFTGGSDDHSSLHVGSKYTIVPGAATLDEFFIGVSEGRSEACGVAAHPKIMAHNFYSIAYQFYRAKHGLGQYVSREPLLRFLERSLLNQATSSQEDKAWFEKVNGLFGVSLPFSFLNANPTSLPGLIIKQAMNIIQEEMPQRGGAAHHNIDLQAEDWHRFVNRVSGKLIANSFDSLLTKLGNADLFEIFNSLSSVGTLSLMLAPYFVAYKVFTKDRDKAILFGEKFRHAKGGIPNSRMKIGHFTDTFSDINGVARTLNQQAMVAQKRNIPLEILSCTKDRVQPFLKNFEPVGEFSIEEYPDLKLYYPHFLDMLDYCYQNNFTHLHSATPGPVGLAALAISKILGLPIYATYHTAFPTYALHLTNDTQMEDLLWNGMVWYYNQMDVVYVPSTAAGEELKRRGVKESKVRFYERGVDVDRFHPSKHNGDLKTRFGVPENALTILYVGRVSKEKNMPLLISIASQLRSLPKPVHMVVVGDGPYLPQLKKDLIGAPVTFTGFLDGDDLPAVYASCDVLIFPSTTDTFGNVVLEAQASGIPALVTDQGGPQENVIPGKTGFVLRADDPEGFVRQIHRLAKRPALLRRMKENARTYMENRAFEPAFMKLWDTYQQPIEKESPEKEAV